MSVDCEVVVIGAGVVGLAIAAKLSQSGHEVIILEAEPDYGSVTSARNSEVIHAGIYYSNNSLKARYCVQGKHQLYAYCKQRHIPHRNCGKLIVASDDAQLGQLTTICQKAVANGVSDLQLLSAQQAQALEPHLFCTGALLSPSTGIVDSHALMVSLLGDAENHGAVLVCRTRVSHLSYDKRKTCYQLQTHGDEDAMISAQQVVNAAGHGAAALANAVLEDRTAQRFDPVMYKGNYFSLAAASPFSRLVYPVPEKAGLGVHLTIDMAGRARFGPDVEPIETLDHAVNPDRSRQFYAAIRRYWPALPDDALLPDYSGIRPRVRINGELYPDFLIQGPEDHGLPGLVNLMSIESPGLTASLAIADAVSNMSLKTHK